VKVKNKRNNKRMSKYRHKAIYENDEMPISFFKDSKLPVMRKIYLLEQIV